MTAEMSVWKLLKKKLKTLMAAQNVNVKPGSQYVFYINNVTNIIISFCQ